MKCFSFKTITLCSILFACIAPAAYAQYDDSVQALWAQQACRLFSNGVGYGNMSQIMMLLANPIAWTGSNVDPNVGLKYMNWIETTRKQRGDKVGDMMVVSFFSKTLKTCPNNFGMQETQNIKNEIAKSKAKLTGQQ
jgi:hypothetical protein